MPYEQTRDGILDAWHTLHNAKVISAMLQSDDDKRYAAMMALGKWTSGSLSYTDGTLGGIKVDGTSFHHGGHYPGYSVGAFGVLGDYCWFTKDTDFAIDEPARRVFKHTLMTLLDYCNLRDWGVGVCGRHPFNGAIPELIRRRLLSSARRCRVQTSMRLLLMQVLLQLFNLVEALRIKIQSIYVMN